MKEKSPLRVLVVDDSALYRQMLVRAFADLEGVEVIDVAVDGVEALEKIDIKGLSVIDVGCGSGVLSIAAAKLGAGRVYGFDNDPFSVKNAAENVIINSVSNIIIIEEADLKTVKAEPFDLVFANILSKILISNLSVFSKLLKPGGKIIFSGLLVEEEAGFCKSIEEACFHIFRVTKRDEWIAVHACL